MPGAFIETMRNFMGELSGVRLLLRGFGGVGGGGGLLLLFEDLGFGFGIRFGLVGV